MMALSALYTIVYVGIVVGVINRALITCNLMIIFIIKHDDLINTVPGGLNRIILSFIHPFPFPVTNIFIEDYGIEFFSGIQ